MYYLFSALLLLLFVPISFGQEKLPQRPPVPDIYYTLVGKVSKITSVCECTSPANCLCPTGQCECVNCNKRPIDKVIQVYEQATSPSVPYYSPPTYYAPPPPRYFGPPPMMMGGFGGPMMGGMACGPGG